MWPRGDGTIGPGADMTASRRSKNSGLSGFVSFMTRRDAEEALREFDGLDWGGSILRVGWSKAVPVAAKPMYGEDNPPSALQQLLKTTQCPMSLELEITAAVVVVVGVLVEAIDALMNGVVRILRGPEDIHREGIIKFSVLPLKKKQSQMYLFALSLSR